MNNIKEKMKMLEKVKNVIAKTLNISLDKITMETDLQNDLGADSLDAVDIIMALEDAFEVSISDEDAQNLKRVSDIVNYLESNK